MKRIFALVLALVMVFGFSTVSFAATDKTVRISIDEWIGWQSLVDANGGLTTAPDSLNAKRGISVEFVVMNDATTSSAALISGELQGAGYTVNRYAFLQSKFDEAKLDVVMPFITNFSNGGDGIIAKSDIISINDLVGRKIAVPAFSEAQTLVEWLLNNSDLSEADKKQIRGDMVYFETADDTAKAFFSGQVDAAATWEPYLTQAASSTDSRILFDTSMSTNLILDGLVFRKDFVEKNEKFIVNLIDAALEAASMYKVEFSNIRQLPMFELMSDDEIIDMANGADLATCAQNATLLSDTAVTMYRDMANVWLTVGEKAYPEKAESAFTDKYVRQLLKKYPDTGDAMPTALSDDERKLLIEATDSLLDYSASITFETNSLVIRPSCYSQLDKFVGIAKILDGVYIRLDGNASKRAPGITDKQIEDFSEKRANAVKDYFVSKGIAAERIVCVGHGDSNLVDNENPCSMVNCRTEFHFMPKRGW